MKETEESIPIMVYITFDLLVSGTRNVEFTFTQRSLAYSLFYHGVSIHPWHLDLGQGANTNDLTSYRISDTDVNFIEG
jgi:hypothetical protein